MTTDTKALEEKLERMLFFLKVAKTGNNLWLTFFGKSHFGNKTFRPTHASASR